MHFTLQPMFSCNKVFTNHYLPSLCSVCSRFVLCDFLKHESQPTKLFSHLPNAIGPVAGKLHQTSVRSTHARQLSTYGTDSKAI